MKKNVFFFLFFLFSSVSFAQKNCCQGINSKNKISVFANQIIIATGQIGTFKKENLDSLIDNYKKLHNADYKQLIKRIDQLNNLDSCEKECFNSFFTSDVISSYSWYLYLKQGRPDKENKSTLSTEFCKGFGFQIEISQGNINLFKNSETALISGRGLLSYTFSKNDCGGRVRLMLGPSFYYWKQNIVLFLNPRAEIRIKDKYNNLGSLWNSKIIIQANISDKYLILGPGIAIELAKQISIQLLAEYMINENNYLIHTGLSYRFRK